jgi:hypothetical protein
LYDIRNLGEGFYNNNGNPINLEEGESSFSHNKKCVRVSLYFHNEEMT